MNCLDLTRKLCHFLSSDLVFVISDQYVFLFKCVLGERENVFEIHRPVHVSVNESYCL